MSFLFVISMTENGRVSSAVGEAGCIALKKSCFVSLMMEFNFFFNNEFYLVFSKLVSCLCFR